ncbi:MAG: hypothetical protein EOO07_08600 [Chitinophagaceae bacterium]|nr:MAG: hypothetical protein EOO07_08600 [Chitinophagaceae bacterium]
MKKFTYLFLLTTFLFLSCSKIEQIDDMFNPSLTANKVLLLKVDYLTNTFEGGKELTFTSSASTFTITTDYKSPGDFGNIKLTYKELDEKLFDGTIIWMGKGQINFPTDLIAPKYFEPQVSSLDFVNPIGFENIFNPNNQTHNYTPIWSKIQHLPKVREYLKSNPTATVKIFLYTPSVGAGNPADWDWIILLKN